jgi:hypothetical protein
MFLYSSNKHIIRKHTDNYKTQSLYKYTENTCGHNHWYSEQEKITPNSYLEWIVMCDPARSGKLTY